jgi:hypothetical protein
MKKLLFFCLFASSVSFAQAQDKRVETTLELEEVGYSVSPAKVFIANFNGVNMYRAAFASGSKYVTPKRRCRKGVGCCKSGYVDFDEMNNIHLIVVNNQCGDTGQERGQMWYNQDENWIESNQ